MDPISFALYEAGAPAVNSSEFWLLNGDGEKGYPFANSPFQVYRLPGRRIRVHQNIHDQWGVRLGSNARRDCANRLRKQQYFPPALREFFPREVLGRFRARGQFGFPAYVRADGRLGFSATGCRNWEVGSGICEARRFILIRLAGPVAKGPGAENASAQKAKVGFRPCCEKVTRVAAPAAFGLGECSRLKGMGMDLSALRGPWAGRR